MKRTKALQFFSLFTLILLLSSFSPRQEQKVDTAIVNYAWYSPAGQFIAWSTLGTASVVSDADTNPVGGTLVLLGYTNGGPGLPPSGTLVYQLYTH